MNSAAFYALTVVLLAICRLSVQQQNVPLHPNPRTIDEVGVGQQTNILKVIVRLYDNAECKPPPVKTITLTFIQDGMIGKLATNTNKLIRCVTVEVIKRDPNKPCTGHLHLHPIDDQKDITDICPGDTNVDDDPHVRIAIPGSDPLCFDFGGYDVVELISVKKTGLAINAKLVDYGKKHQVLIGEVGITSKGCSIHVTPKEIVLNQKIVLEWKDVTTVWKCQGNTDVAVEISKNHLVIPIGEGINADIQVVRSNHLNVQLENLDVETDAAVDGIIGRVATLIQTHSLLEKEDGTQVMMIETGSGKFELFRSRSYGEPCWRLEKAVERILGKGASDLERKCLLCPSPGGKSRKNMHEKQ